MPLPQGNLFWPHGTGQDSSKQPYGTEFLFLILPVPTTTVHLCGILCGIYFPFSTIARHRLSKAEHCARRMVDTPFLIHMEWMNGDNVLVLYMVFSLVVSMQNQISRVIQKVARIRGKDSCVPLHGVEEGVPSEGLSSTQWTPAETHKTKLNEVTAAYSPTSPKASQFL